MGEQGVYVKSSPLPLIFKFSYKLNLKNGFKKKSLENVCKDFK